MAEITADVAARTGFTVEELRGPGLRRPLAHARQEVMFLARQHGRSYPQIGSYLGGRDHTTVIHGERAHALRIGAP